MKTLLSAGAIALVSTSAFAGDWTGGYLGFGVGYADIGISNNVPGGNGATYGLHGGYDYDFGDWVLGGELEYGRLDIAVNNGATVVDDVGSLKVKLGYDFGSVLGYAVAGGSRAYTSNLGDDTGAVYGFGIAYQVTPQLTISGEALRHDFGNFNGSGVDVDADTINLRASFRF